MSQLVLTPTLSALEECLAFAAPEVRSDGACCWQLRLESGLPLHISAPVGDRFLLFDAPAPLTCEFERAPEWLLWNASLAGNVKLALVPHPWRLRLCAEIPMCEDADISARIAETLCGVRAASRLLTGWPALAGDGSDLAQPASADGRNNSGNLPALLRETGWPFREREGGVAVVELAMRGGCRIVLKEHTSGVRAAMELLRADSLAPCSRLALAALLLSAGGTLRLARPYAEAAGPFTCGFEVQLAGGTTAGELEHALEALAVACWACKEEVHSLFDNAVAEAFLAIRNLPPLLAREEF